MKNTKQQNLLTKWTCSLMTFVPVWSARTFNW